MPSVKSGAKQLLETKGYLTVNQLVAYLAEEFPLFAMSYPPIMRLVRKEGSPIPAVKIGGQYRIDKEHIDRYILRLQMEKEGLTPPPNPISAPKTEAPVSASVSTSAPADTKKKQQAPVVFHEPQELDIETVELENDPKFEYIPDMPDTSDT